MRQIIESKQSKLSDEAQGFVDYIKSKGLNVTTLNQLMHNL